MLPRHHDNLTKWLNPGKVVVLYGPRRVGKTTLVKNFIKKSRLFWKIDTGENIETRKILSSSRFDKILPYAQERPALFLDEAQLIPGVGQGLKIIVDQLPKTKIIATGSSSFDLAGQIGEPLVGRKWTLTLYPVAQLELRKLYTPFELHQQLPNFLLYGSYPEVLTAQTPEKKTKVLKEITSSYLFKDILSFEGVRGSNFAHDLTKLIALQVGSEVSLNELSLKLGVNIRTVERYLDILEKSFIIYSLAPFSRNLRSEQRSKRKYYFLDNGIRNAIISQFSQLDSRNDVGALWENFLVCERLKKQAYGPIYANNYFWRTWEQKEVDWVEERDGKLFGFEFKWGKNAKYKKPQEFLTAYPEASIDIITQENYLDFVCER